MRSSWFRPVTTLALLTSLLALSGCKKEGIVFTSMNPPSGKPSGGDEVRIRGSGFRALGTLDIRVGPRPATNVAVADDETIVLTTPECREADHGRALDVNLLTGDGRSFILRAAFTCRRPEASGANSDLQRRL